MEESFTAGSPSPIEGDVEPGSMGQANLGSNFDLGSGDPMTRSIPIINEGIANENKMNAQRNQLFFGYCLEAYISDPEGPAAFLHHDHSPCDGRWARTEGEVEAACINAHTQRAETLLCAILKDVDVENL